MEFQFLSDPKFLANSIIRGVVWAFLYYYVRRGWNPDNKGDISKFKSDAIYGGIAVSLTAFVTNILTMIISYFFGIQL